jgi:hypothetical protein
MTSPTANAGSVLLPATHMHMALDLAHPSSTTLYSTPTTSIMDFRNPECMTDTDEGILEEPYRPFYNIFGSKPVLVKQYEIPPTYNAQMTDGVVETTNTTELLLESRRGWDVCCLTMSPRMREIMLRTNAVRSPSNQICGLLTNTSHSVPLMAEAKCIHGHRVCSYRTFISPKVQTLCTR